ncbi:MAG: class C sortase [Defluviitaleaceae bacterium]|nr:class C sortase [Defluviitaleaceae bacterium]
MDKRTKMKLSRRMQSMLMIILLILGMGILIYPDVSNWYQSNRHEAIRQEYNERVAIMAREEVEYELERARMFNNGLTGIHIEDPFVPGSGSVRSDEYYSILNFNGVMGSIEIPSIGVDLPIFHGTSDDVLARGIGHMENTPFPIGGYGKHGILTGHTGLVNSRLFTDLVSLDHGDLFFIQILDKRLAYEVDRIDWVYPHEIEILYTDEHHDWITLVTCYPYGVNTHRLLVRGTRISYEPGMVAEIEPMGAPLNIRVLIIIGFAVVFMLIILFYQHKKKRIAQASAFDKQIEKEYENLQKGE